MYVINTYVVVGQLKVVMERTNAFWIKHVCTVHSKQPGTVMVLVCVSELIMDVTVTKARDLVTEKKMRRAVEKAVLWSCFRDMHKELCNGKAGLCEAMKPIKGTELLKFLRRVTFEGLSGDMFRFDQNGDGPARYNIIHFKQISSGKYQWIKVGEYMDGELRLNMSGKMWAGVHGR